MEILVLAEPGPAWDRIAAAAPTNASVTQVRSWGDVVRRLTSGARPSALVVDAEIIASASLAVIEQLCRKGLLVPTAVFFLRMDPELLRRAWPMARFAPQPLFDGAGLDAELRALAGDDERASDHLIRLLELRCPTALALLRLLESEKALLTSPVSVIAARLGMSRSTLYRRLAAAGAPATENLQMLFRLLAAIGVLRRGGAAENAASVADLADPCSLRRTLAINFGMGLSDARREQELCGLVERWLRWQIRPRCARERAGWSSSRGRASPAAMVRWQ